MYLSNFIDRIRLPFRKDKESYSCLYRMMGFYPRCLAYYKQAFIHSSVHGENGQSGNRLNNNERLEFLGDAILDAVVGDIVYHRFKGKREGFLTNARSKIVQRESLNRIAAEIGLLDLIQASSNSHHSHNSYLGGNAFEALVGAIYLDRGYDYCMYFMEKRILNRFVNLEKVAYKEVNFKSKLIEWAQKNRVKADFLLVEQQQDATSSSPVFQSKVRIEGIEVGTGRGYSKKESQQHAAKEAMALLKRQPKLIEKIFAEKSKRTAMEEMPTAVLEVDDVTLASAPAKGAPVASPASQPESKKSSEKEKSEFDLSAISLKQRELTRDEIIAAAEEQAFLGGENS